MSKTMQDYILKERLRAWIYSGVDAEIELHQLEMEQSREDTGIDNRAYNNKRILKLKDILVLINQNINELSKQWERNRLFWSIRNLELEVLGIKWWEES